MASAGSEDAQLSLPPEIGGAEGFVAALAASSGAALAYVDTHERVRFMTDEAAAWLGLDARDAIGKTLRELHEPASYTFFEPYLRRALAGERVHYERASRHADGRALWMSVSLAPHRDREGR